MALSAKTVNLQEMTVSLLQFYVRRTDPPMPKQIISDTQIMQIVVLKQGQRLLTQSGSS